MMWEPGRGSVSKRALCVVTFALFVFGGELGAQVGAGAGTFRGRVTDETGAPVPTARVVVVNEETRAQRDVLTGDDGEYQVSRLAAGIYTIRAERLGYESAERTEQALESGEEKVVDFVLETAPVELAAVEVVATTRTTTPVTQIPGSVTVVSREEIANEQVTAERIEEILSRKVPGFNPTNRGLRQIRGRTAQVFINGVPANEQLRASIGADINLLSPDQLARVEVSRGASSAYGFGSPGGIIALMTPRARSEELTLDALVRSSFAPHHPNDSYQTHLYLSASRIAGKFDYSVGASIGYDGLELDPDGEPALGFNSASGPTMTLNSKESRWGLDGSFGYDLGDAGSLRLTGTFGYLDIVEGYLLEGIGEYREAESVIVRHPPADNGFRRSYTVDLAYHNPDLWGSAAKLELFASDAYTEVFRPTFLETGVTARDEQTNEYRGFRSAVTTPLEGVARGLSATYGFDILRNRYFRPVFLTDTDAVELFVSPDVTFDSYAPFLQVDLRLGELHPTGGVRHEEYRGHVETAAGAILGGDILGGDIQPADLTLFNAALLYELDQADLFATFTQGAEISQIGRAAFAMDTAATAERIDPQPAKSNQYEIGIRGGRRSLDYAVSAFFTESDLLSALQPNPAGPATLPLIPLREPRKFWGVEGSLDWRALDAWRLGGVLTWYDGVRELPTGEERRISSGEVPPLLFSANAEYAPRPWWRSTLQLDFRASRDPFGTSTEFDEGRVDSVLLVHLSGALDVGPGTLRIGVRNVLNESYFSIPAEASNGGFLWIPEEGTRSSFSYSVTW